MWTWRIAYLNTIFLTVSTERQYSSASLSMEVFCRYFCRNLGISLLKEAPRSRILAHFFRALSFGKYRFRQQHISALP